MPSNVSFLSKKRRQSSAELATPPMVRKEKKNVFARALDRSTKQSRRGPENEICAPEAAVSETLSTSSPLSIDNFFSTSSYNLAHPRPRPPYTLQPAFASVDDFRRRPSTSASFVDRFWAGSSLDLVEDLDEALVEEEDSEDEEELAPPRAGFIRKARLSCSSVLSFKLRLGRQRADGVNSEIWSQSNLYSTESIMSIPPPIPARSRLREAAPPKSTVSSNTTPTLASNRGAASPQFPQRQSVAFDSLPSPSLYSSPRMCSRGLSSPSTPNFNSPTLHSSPRLGDSPSYPLPYDSKRRQSRVISGGTDPLKVRDGAAKRPASSGVYTPPSFQGPCGPTYTPSPTNSYTRPRPLDLGPRSPSSSIRSSNSSQSDSTAPRTPSTPKTPKTKFGKVLSRNAKRLSVMSLGLGSSASKRSESTSSSIRGESSQEGYFPNPTPSLNSLSTGSHLSQPSWEIHTPTSATHPYYAAYPSTLSGSGSRSGSGYYTAEPKDIFPPEPAFYNFAERRGSTASDVGYSSGYGSGYGGERVRRASGVGQGPAVPRGKRKPVPKVALEDEMGGMTIGEAV
ncbi:hypothetical protein L198_00704 [Cryptococcus wingfieldii CBS 7118]|uniref:Uncharacterized protein n=1 Tax=Cryptococcus wingfieldii CBS 7118 TaxID=1295528 RepID=A0A1E3K7I8_9TREE|nr:hypothetical protein L198_00704 [Cryptococcus wingfieldii CBS 7118]ODO08965.1 hypothetical protein L198_00704 [Cryptococcus wingfieldii CBS 7118]